MDSQKILCFGLLVADYRAHCSFCFNGVVFEHVDGIVSPLDLWMQIHAKLNRTMLS